MSKPTQKKAPGARQKQAVEGRSTERETRRQILALLLHQGPSSASSIGEELRLSAAGVRRHLDILVDDGLAEIAPARRSTAKRGRGRPAKNFQLTDAGREQFGHGYDALAADALQALRAAGGDEAVRAFAEQRIQGIMGSVPPAGYSPESVARTAYELAQAFSENGYAAAVHDGTHSVQLCQHHCPIAHVAEDFPELCEAEHRAIAEKLGHHVQPLASIANGHGICTTNIPLTPISGASTAGSAPRSGTSEPTDHYQEQKGAAHDSGPHQPRHRRER